MEKHATNKGFILILKKTYKSLAGLGILLAGSIFLYTIFTKQLSLLLGFLFFAPILKILQSLLVFRITVDSVNKIIKFNHSLSQKIYHSSDIDSWTIVKINNNSIDSSSLAKGRHIEVETKLGDKFVYPLPTQKSLNPLVLWSDRELEELFTPTFGKPRSAKQISSLRFQSLKYDLNFFLI